MWRPACLAAAALAAGAAGEPIPESVFVRGATGDVEIANGQYDLAQEEFNDKHCYKKQHTMLWICRDQHDLWNFQPHGFLGSSQGIMVSTQKHADSPIGAGPWRVWADKIPGTEQGGWIASSVQVLDSPDADTVPAADSREMRLRQTVAGMLFGALFLGLVVLSLLSSTDVNIRSYSYRLLGTWVTFLISFLFVGAVWDLFIKQLLPAPPPRGLGLGYHVSPGIQIVLSFFFFTLCYSISLVVGWKCQYRRSRLMVLKTLAAHITAVWGITTFTIIQYQVVFGTGSQFEGLFGPVWTRRVLAFAVVVAAWYIFAIYRWASMGARQEYFHQPPQSPWPADSKPVVDLGAGRDTGCLGPWQTRAATEQKPLSQYVWGDFLDDGEDEASVVTLGFLFAQAVMFCKTGELPGFRGHYTHEEGDHSYRFFGFTLATMVIVFFVILAVRSKVGHGGRSGKILQRTAAMALTWMFYRASCWNTRLLFLEHRQLALVITCFATSIACFVLVVLADKVLDALLGRSSASGGWSALQAGDRMPLSEVTMRGIMCCLGLIMALPWQLTIETAVVTLVQSQEFLLEHMILSRNLITIVLAVAMVVPWRRTLLPKSEMKESAMGEEIHHELMQLDRAENFMT